MLLLFYRFTRHTMKNFLSLILLAGSIFLLGCTKPVPVDIETSTWTNTTPTNIPEENIPKRQSYENKIDGFSLQFPGDRTFQEKVYGASVVFTSPITETDKIKENVMIVKSPLDKPYTLEEYYLILKAESAKQPNYVEIESSTIKINDLDAKKIIYKSTSNSTKLQFQQVLFIKDDFVYTFTYTATEATFAEYAQKINEMIATLEIK